MILDHFKRSWTATAMENRFQRVANLGLIGLCVILALLLSAKDTTVVLVPPNLGQQEDVSKRSASVGMIKTWALFAADLLGNVTPDSADFIKNGIGPILMPEIYQNTITAIERQAQEMKRDRVAQRFDSRQIQYEISTRKVFVTGYSTLTGPAGNEKRHTRTYEFMFSVSNYKPMIEHLETYMGDARTQEVLRKEEEAKSRVRAKEDQNK